MTVVSSLPLCCAPLSLPLYRPSLSRGTGEEVSDESCAALIALAVRRMGRDEPSVRGWVLEDYPETATQAMLLEKALSGYDPAIKHPTRWSRKSVLAACCPEPPPSTDLLPSALDLVFVLQAPRQQVRHRRERTL